MRVLQSFSEPKGEDNPYLQLTVSSLPDDVRCVFFSWRRALFGSYDVFHVHWVESLVAGNGRIRTLMAWAAMSTLLVRLRLTRTPVVRTLHNRTARGRRGRAYEQFLKNTLDGMTVTCIRMNSDNAGLEHARSVVIPHGHYRDCYAKYPVPIPIEGRILNFGLIRQYKGLDQLVPAFMDWESPDAELHIAGKVVDPDLGRLIANAVSNDSRVTLLPGHASEPTLAREIGECEFVVLPYDELYNSGCLFLALSLNRPVLVPAGRFADELSAEIGEGWIYTYVGDLNSKGIDEAAHHIRTDVRAASPDLSQRDWSAIGAATSDVYYSAVAGKSRN